MAYVKRKKFFALYSLITTAIEEAALIAVLLWVLPRFGINAPPWLIAVLAAGWAAWSYLAYRMGDRAFNRIPAVGREALVGARCRTATPLSPTGYVQAGSELWRAHSISGEVNAGFEVVIIEVQGLTLLVTPSAERDPPGPLPRTPAGD